MTLISTLPLWYMIPCTPAVAMTAWCCCGSWRGMPTSSQPLVKGTTSERHGKAAHRAVRSCTGGTPMIDGLWHVRSLTVPEAVLVGLIHRVLSAGALFNGCRTGCRVDLHGMQELFPAWPCAGSGSWGSTCSSHPRTMSTWRRALAWCPSASQVSAHGQQAHLDGRLAGWMAGWLDG